MGEEKTDPYERSSPGGLLKTVCRLFFLHIETLRWQGAGCSPWPSPPSYLLKISLGVVERDVLDDFREFFHVSREHSALNPVAQDIA